MPVCVCLIFLFGLFRRVPVFTTFVSGAKEGFRSAVEILPTLVGLVVAVEMLESPSGALDIFFFFLYRLLWERLGIPPECSSACVITSGIRGAVLLPF